MKTYSRSNSGFSTEINIDKVETPEKEEKW